MSDEEPVKMTEHEDHSVTMQGYLDKRGKMKLVSTWKRYWFVLKGQLLLYYKSQMECDNLSACRGSLNMGIASCVRPGAHRGPPANGAQGYTIEVVTRSQVITLRTKDRSHQEQWLKALLESMALPISTPIRNSTGPMHFRYSLDNLPVIEEAETEDKNIEKQRTLPHSSSVARRDSVLGRIKRIGGTSYGGSLDTILKRRPNNHTTQQHSPQQPKIPRIKAVDRMLGMQSSDVVGENNTEGKEKEESTILKHNSPDGDDVNSNEHCLNNTSTESSINISSRSGNSDISIMSDLQNSSKSEIHREKSKISTNENINESFKEEKKQSNVTEKEKHVIYVKNKDDIVVENKLYEKVKTNENKELEDIQIRVEHKEERYSVNNNVYEDSEKERKKVRYSVKNSLYEDSKKERNQIEDSDSSEELGKSTQEQNFKHKDKLLYEEVKSSKTIPEVEESENEEEEEEEYYSQYDKLSLLKSLSDIEQEPDLPPRPSLGSSNECVKSHKKEDEDAEYSSYYETSLNTTSPPSYVASSGADSPSTKKKSKLHNKIKLKKKKSPSKESVVSDEGSASTGNKKKRKMSFLRRMLRHYRKKPESQSNLDNVGDSDEPEYETVDYIISLQQKTGTEVAAAQPESSTHEKSVSPEKEVQKEKLFGTSLLTDQAMQELKMKLRNRDDSICSDNAPSATVPEENEGYEHISSDEIPDKKPIPTPRSGKQKTNHNEQTDTTFDMTRFRCNDGIDRANKPPKLPPRKVARPRSPWHDIPTNNSPIYGNFDDITNSVEQKNSKRLEEQPCKKSHVGEWDQEIGDELLGTPKGFVYIQNKWKAVEKSNELTQKGKSPPKNRSPGDNQVRHKRTASGGSAGKNSLKSDCSDTEHKSTADSSADIYTDVQKLSAKSIIKNINLHSERSADKIGGVHKNEEASEGVGANLNSNEIVKVSTVGEIRLEKSKTGSDSVIKQNIDNLVTNEDIVTLRRPHVDMISVNTHHVLCHKTDFNNIESKNSNFSSSQNFSSDITEEYTNSKAGRYEISSPTDEVLLNSSSHLERLTEKNAKEISRGGVDDVNGEEYDIMPRLNRHSDELNLLLAQLAEITSAPLLPQGAATSLVDIPDSRKPKLQNQKPAQPIPAQTEQFVLGPIRRRRHSDPDYDVPRPHGSLLHILASNRMSSRSNQSQSGQESDVIEATHFFGEADLISSSGRSSLSLRHSVISEVDDQSDTSYYVSMAPDSLEVPQVKDIEETYN